MKLLLLLFTISSVSFSFGQATTEMNILKTPSQNSLFEGVYTYELNTTKYGIDLSIQNGTYIEYDQNGDVLSSGNIEKLNSSSFKLTPITINSGSNISQVLIISNTDSTASSKLLVNVFSEANNFLQELTLKRID